MKNLLNISDDTMISIQNLSKRFERDNLFEGINLVLHSKEKIAFIGKNGSGKTTFFNCLAGKESFDGRIFVSEIKISLMEQEQNFSNLDKTFEEYLDDKNEKLEGLKKQLEEKIGDPEVYENEDKYNSLMDEYNLLLTDPSTNSEQRSTKEILKELKMDKKLLNQKIKNLSGGQKTKLRLAECLSKKADLYLLDEPTNNLDLTTREWLEAYINNNIENLIVISHDRYFLSKVVGKVWDLENQQIISWNYPFDEYLDRKKKHLAVLERKFKDATKKKKQLLESAAEKRHWAAKCGNRTKKVIADRLERQAKELENVENPFDFIKDIDIGFNSKNLHNCNIFRLENVEKKFDKVLFENVDQEIDFGERICIIGENGTGKSTFLKMLIGKIPQSKGDLYRRKDVKIGYFDQELEELDKEQTIMKFFINETDLDEEHLIPFLEKYGFEKESFQKKIKHLSGGEKGRLNILRIAIEKNNILVLDEPTNNLDIYLVESLENALKEFKGTIIFVSHDRYFVDKVATRILEIKDKKISSFKGNYSKYLESRK
ncbi:ABC-F family ATP-binding cassette domain-containing protein [archaeon]|jgi:ATP-binding cassette, subfamily F, member 3|nr:ABC-F family ATP-binding cassette domain-containing protein [archaeon]MBT3577375.1 ABC-F family ATP-binding cassette domain-containing protein [archaeon]MBT6820382.1 ABC-F family ATP-binding cassette domain-containing protein [archaeon]MBT6956143.1 ABC-F family ATP-binding cassette domain-containing protein [archaeon]MBT7025196.1 ABC-F family ATP-binding cassette domain-containing protein [archaeon]